MSSFCYYFVSFSLMFCLENEDNLKPKLVNFVEYFENVEHQFCIITCNKNV